MNKHLEQFIRDLDAEDKDACIELAMKCLETKALSIQALYEEVLGPALNAIGQCKEGEEDCIWKEHLKTSIVKTVLECCYPYVAKKRGKKKIGIKVLVLCPENEQHDVGARMVADFFLLNGYQAFFVGANTPAEQIRGAIQIEQPRYVAISVTDYYNLVAAQKTIKLVRSALGDQVKILVGGTAFMKNKNTVEQFGADAYLETYEDVKRLREEDGKNEAGI